jgi:hypothetical protein
MSGKLFSVLAYQNRPLFPPIESPLVFRYRIVLIFAGVESIATQ